MTFDPVVGIAREAARTLAVTHGAELEAQVEAALRAQGTPPTQYLDPVALGSLVVSTATLAWTIFKDLRGKSLNPTRAAVVERVQTEAPVDDAVIEAVADALFKKDNQ